MRAKLLCGVLGLVSLTWSTLANPEEILTQETGKRTLAQASVRLDEAKQPLDALLQVQLDALDLQKRQLLEAAQEQIRQTDEQVREQIETWKSDVARQIEQLQKSAKKQNEQTQSYVKRQVELVESQKKLIVAQARVTNATTPKAGAGAVDEKLDKILDHLDRLDKRINKVEKGKY